MVAAGWFKECGTAHLEDVSSCRVSVHLLWVFQRHCAPSLLFFLFCFILFCHYAYSSSVEKNFDTARTCRECRATSNYARESRRQLEIIRAYGLPERITSAKSFHLRPINYEYRPEDCFLSGAYPFVGAARQTWEGIRFQRRLHGAILSRDDGHDR